MTDRPVSTDSRLRPRHAIALACAAAMTLALGACGASNDDEPEKPSGGGGAALTSEGYLNPVPRDGQQKGGTLKLLQTGPFQHHDPGQAYFQLDYMFVFAAHRSLYYYAPANAADPIPDLADGPPEVSDDDRTVTVKLKAGIKYGTVADSPINGQEVKAADVKYALERSLAPTVLNGYFEIYFGAIAGSEDAKGGEISGIKTPDDRTIVFELDEPQGATFAKALVMPITMPMPKSHVAPFDAKRPNKYETDPTVQAFTGPYMVSEFEAGRSLVLTRNPNWDAATDPRPAYLDRIEWTLNADANVAGRQILNGTNLANGDTPAAGAVQRFTEQAKDRISFSALGNRFVSLNNKKAPFNDVNVRRAVAAALDRRAMQLTRGGAVTGDIATHFLPPGMAGFDEAGGAKGPDADFFANPKGDPAVAAKYLKEAGFESGKYEGEQIVMLHSADSPAKETAGVVRRNLEAIGFDVKATALNQDAFYDRCQTVADLEKIDICANTGWLPDFSDPYAMLNANFNGDSIVPESNNNFSLQDDPAINKAMNDAALVADPDERAKAWGGVDRMLTENAVAVPWFWDKTVNIVGKDVQGVVAAWNATWDVSFMSLKK